MRLLKLHEQKNATAEADFDSKSKIVVFFSASPRFRRHIESEETIQVRLPERVRRRAVSSNPLLTHRALRTRGSSPCAVLLEAVLGVALEGSQEDTGAPGAREEVLGEDKVITDDRDEHKLKLDICIDPNNILEESRSSNNNDSTDERMLLTA